MRRFCAALLALALLLSGCGHAVGPQQHNATYLDLFDTVTTIIGTGETEEAFRREAQEIYEQLRAYHQLFDIYNDYEGIANLKTVNDRAGISPVTVDSAIIGLLLSCKDYYELTAGKVNPAMGSVLRLWREARELGRLPEQRALALGAAHMDMGCVIIDEAASTVYLSDPEMSLDVGAVAKGWAAQRVAEAAPAGMLISVGGNVCATGPKSADGTPWVVGVQHPDRSGEYLHTICVSGGAVVTSGDYQRYFTVGDKRYHHIIDPATQMPADRWRSVTVVCPDSALADVLSTALFLLPLEEGQALAESRGAQALWVDASGGEYMTPGFQALVRE